MRWPVKLAGLGTSLAINAYRTLKLLDLNISEAGDDPLCGLGHELRFIAGNNILEELVVTTVRADNEFKYWPAFDSLLTESGAFPILHRVSVNVWWFSQSLYYSSRNLGDPDRAMESWFPRLVESKAVEFNFYADSHEHAGLPV